ncbi:MAG: PKD domain-containing protein [Chryseotalea sp. WA131a]|nr:MAG: PKD domain-containing protein [Chryseotalea sp. WA131a]
MEIKRNNKLPLFINEKIVGRLLRATLLLHFLMASSFNCLSQGEIPVDMFTGTPSIQIPLWSLTDYDLVDNVQLNYKSTGLRVGQPVGDFGIGWSLQAGGSITREVKGLPDDFQGVGADLRRGWLYLISAGNGVASDVGGFTNSADLAAGSSCTDETTDYNNLNGYNYNIDTEPDVYSYSVGSFSGKFVFDNSNSTPVIRLVPFVDIKIQPIFSSASDFKIQSFKITTNNGVVYTFDQPVMQDRWTEKLDWSFNPSNPVQFRQRDFSLYDLARYNKKVNFASEWKLSRMDSPSGAYIVYNYTSYLTTSIEPFIVGFRSPTSSGIISKSIFSTRTDGEQKTLASIRASSGQQLTIATSENKRTILVSDSRRAVTSIKRYELSVGSFLTSIQEISGCDLLPPYKFTYVGVTPDGAATEYPTQTSFEKDFWGYYNGKTNTHAFPKLYVYPALPPSERYRIHPIPGYSGQVYVLDGSDRIPNSNSMQIGVLETIQYPTGGASTIKYEPNSYYDQLSAQTLIGGGLRVASVTYFDGINTASKIIKNFRYNDESGQTSGRLLTKPAFAIPTYEYWDPTTSSPEARKSYAQLSAGSAQEMWEYLTVRTEDDLFSTETTRDSYIGYKTVTVTRPGSGSAKFEFSLPGSFGESINGDWISTQNKFVRNSATCPTMGIVSDGGTYAFPYAPNTNYEYERGLLLTKTEFNQAGTKVRETINLYQSLIVPGTQPLKVWGLKYDRYSNSLDAFFYGKYYYLTGVQKVALSEMVTVFDDADVSRKTTSKTEFFYESPYHKLLSRVKTTTSEGFIFSTRNKYPLDYGAIPYNSDNSLKMIQKLQTSFRNSTFVEQVQSVNKGMGEKTVSANLIKFNEYGTSVLPQYILSLNAANGITDFKDSNQLLQGGTYIFDIDSRYQIKQSIEGYDLYQKPLTAIGTDNIPMSTHWGLKKTLPIATASNAKAGQFAYSNFEAFGLAVDISGFEFQLSGSQAIGMGRTGNNALHPVAKLTRTIDKAEALNYILSFWMKKQSGSVDFNVTIKNTSLTTTYYSNTFTVNPSTSNFEYFQKVIPSTSFPASFVIELQGQFAPGITVVSSNSLLPVIDDVLFYPDNSDVTTYSHDPAYGVQSVTNSRGLTRFTKYDNLGRAVYELDQDNNILKKNTYKYAATPTPILTANFSWADGQVYDFTDIVFAAFGNDCIDGATYQWDFGGGVLLSGKSVTYNYSTTGTKAVILNVTHPTYGFATVTRSFSVALKTWNANICAKGVANYNQCTGDVLQTYTCSSITANPPSLGTIFQALSFTLPPGESIVGYQWKKKYTTDLYWTNVSTTTSYTASSLYNDPGSIDILFEATTNTGRKCIAGSAISITTCN